MGSFPAKQIKTKKKQKTNQLHSNERTQGRVVLHTLPGHYQFYMLLRQIGCKSELPEASSPTVISSLSLVKHKIQRLGMSLTSHKKRLLPYLPPVSLYMSLTVRVDISVNGFPLRPPVSFL